MREEARGSKVRTDVSAAGRRIALLVARFNEEITRELLEGARACIAGHGGTAADTDVFHVPGAWELPQAARRLADASHHDAIVALGCVIRGETPHFDFISAEASRGLGAVARSTSIPVAFGVLTTETLDQARARASRDGHNKGWEATLAALEMIGLFQELGELSGDG